MELVTAPVGVGLTRVTVSTPHRRVDVALPDHILVADLLPHLLRHAGVEIADEGESHGGWTLRRTSGGELDADSDLASQSVRDGELLHLAPRRLNWAEPAYDDVVDVIATSARRAGRSWSGVATRRYGLAVVGIFLVLGAALLVWAGSPWLVPGVVGLGAALLLVLSGILLARLGGDAEAGAVLGGYALLYAALGAALVSAPEDQPAGRLDSAQVVAGSAALILTSVLAMAGVVALARIFAAGLGTGIAGLLGGLLCLSGTSPASAAAVVLTLAIGLLPAYPLLATTLGKIPTPVLPQRPEEILEDAPLPDRASVFAAVARASEILAGCLLAAATTSVIAALMLLTDGGLGGIVLALVGAGVLVLRGRLFPTAAQRLPLLIGGVAIIAVAGYGWMRHTPPGSGRVLLLAVVLALAATVLGGTLRYSTRSPSPYLGRTADVLDTLTIMAMIPLACWVLGVYQTVQGLFSSVG
ncbi:type VII secretion integral membrane protein EccD [Dactylosporangium sp. NPDC048998]|uniref:type VII secretion integral membrane protein EccD n=1 Tax=Dactylosporangium sp. NPDC048998 TaxID=3363976 RepID=UPI003710C072